MREICGQYQIEVEVGGHVSFARQVSNSLHRHNFYELALCLSGEGEFKHGSDTSHLRTGDLFVSDPNVPHEISSYGHQNLSIFFVRMHVQPLPGDSHTGAKMLDRFLEAHASVANGQGRLCHYIPLLERKSDQTSKLLSAMALEMVEALTVGCGSETSAIEDSEVERIVKFIDANLHRRIEEREISSVFGISDRTLRRRFQAATGTTVREEINHRRMRRAAHLLLTGYSVREAGNELGIADPSQFHKCFVRVFSISPKQFQLSYQPGWLHVSTRP